MPQRFNEGEPVGVVVIAPLDKILDYTAPAGGAQTGAIVRVNLGRRKAIGVVWGAGASGLPADKLRPIAEVLDAAPFTPVFREFLARLADYTLSSLNAVVGLAIRENDLFAPPSAPHYGFGRMPEELPRMTESRTRIVNFLHKQPEKMFSFKELERQVGATRPVIKGLMPSGLIRTALLDSQPPLAPLDPAHIGKTLTDLQTQAGDQLRAQVAARAYNCTLLKGVTGSGKTEVYMEAVAECLQSGRQALVLLPEIALSVSFVGRFAERFGGLPGQWHSGISAPARRQTWRAAADGQLGVVIGARSALFLPFKNLGLIVVDEEHDGSYKQSESVFYSARDMAVWRAQLEGAAVVLSTATPALETWVNARDGKYARIDLPVRYGAARYPDIEMIDLRAVARDAILDATQAKLDARSAEPQPKLDAQSAEHGESKKAKPKTESKPRHWISPPLVKQVRARLARGEQSLLFLNRRGYAPITVCQDCGEQIACRQCDFRLVEHRYHNCLMCHHCGETTPIPTACNKCESTALAHLGPGIERVAEEARQHFPDARLALLSSDMALSARALKDKIAAIAAGEADIIIGTQLVAKGHHFPHLTCVGVIDADLGLFGSDLRAAERSFQLIRQVAGRAGRADKRGVAYLQTYQPDHPVMLAIQSGQEEDFWRAEAEQREVFAAPPFTRWVAIILSGVKADEVRGFGMAMARAGGPLRDAGAELFGPAEAPISLVRGRYRMRMLVKAAKGVDIWSAVRAWRSSVEAVRPKDVRCYIDVDPQSFF